LKIKWILPTLGASIAIAAFLSQPAGAQAGTAHSAAGISKAERFRGGLADIHKRHGVPAVSVAVYSAGGLEAAEALGLRRVVEPIRVELSDRFFIGSITKPLTATVAATMVDAGLIAWTTTPAQVWPSEAGRMHPRMRAVTLRQLLSHEAGIVPFTKDEEMSGAPAASGAPREQRSTFARWILAQPPTSAIGSHRYSNAGYGVAAAMMETLAGRAWEDLVRERVFEPLAMSSCGFGWPRSAGDQPHGHRLSAGRCTEGTESQSRGLPASIAPAGDIHCSVSDLARFGEAHLLGTAGRHPLLRTETFRGMHTPTGNEEYVLGWNLQEIGWGHLGGVTQGWHASLFVSPARRIVVAVATNARQPGTTDRLMDEVTQLAFDLFATRPLRQP
jgi:CubicO group peptidase (beta-lactamase class C family)